MADYEGSELGLVVLALTEVDPVLAQIVLATGCNGGGLALPGLLGWLPTDELYLVMKAVLLVRDDDADPLDATLDVKAMGAWRHPRPVDRVRMAAGMKVWAAAQEASDG